MNSDSPTLVAKRQRWQQEQRRRLHRPMSAFAGTGGRVKSGMGRGRPHHSTPQVRVRGWQRKEYRALGQWQEVVGAAVVETGSMRCV